MKHFQAFQIAAALLLASTVAFAKHPKIAQDLDGADPSSNVDVIVQFKQLPTEAQHQKMRGRGGVHRKSLDLVNGSVYSVPAGKLADMANDPDVAYISPDRPLQGVIDNAAPAVLADIAFKYGWDGTGIGVAVLDSGIADIADLHSSGSTGSRIVYAESFVPRNATSDNYGHGTHVSGIIAGNGASSTGTGYKVTLRGIAPNANLINLRVLDSNGAGSDSYVIAAINRAIQLRKQFNIRVMNLSLGRPIAGSYKDDPLCQAVEAAWKAGIVVVVAAGNSGRDNSQSTSGYGTITAPGNDPYVITVGAMKTLGTPSRSDDLIASYSSKGPTLLDHIVKPDLVAPGNRMVSDSSTGMNLVKQYSGNRVDYSYYMTSATGRSFDYFVLSGTSMATPMVSGAAALLLQQNTNLTPDQVKARLMKTASKAFPTSSVATDPVTGDLYTSHYDIFTVGAGYLDVWAALNSSDTASTTKSAQSPTAKYDSKTGKVSINYGKTLLWGDTLLWGSSLVWGSNVLVGGTNIVWGDSLVWGSSATQGFNIVWGDSLVWGETNKTSAEAVGIAINGEK